MPPVFLEMTMAKNLSEKMRNVAGLHGPRGQYSPKRVRVLPHPDIEDIAERRRQTIERQMSFHRMQREASERLRALRDRECDGHHEMSDFGTRR